MSTNILRVLVITSLMLVSGIVSQDCLAQDSKTKCETTGPNDVFTVVEQMPQYPGGEKARVDFMMKNLKYPKSAQKSGLQGTVYVSFIVEKDGSIKKAEVIRGIGTACDQEALRVVKMMPKWKAGKQRGKTVRTKYTLPISFSLGK